MNPENLLSVKVAYIHQKIYNILTNNLILFT